MPRSDSPPPPARGSRRSPSPRRDRAQDRDRDRGDSRRDDRQRNHRDHRDDRHRSSRDADRDRNRDRDNERDRNRDGPSRRSRSPSPPRPSHSSGTRKPRELSFYKKSSSGGGSGSMGSFSHRRDPLDAVEESAKERMERRERGNVPARFGGTREQGVRNTMSSQAAAPQGSSMGSLKRGGDPLDRLSAPGSASGGASGFGSGSGYGGGGGGRGMNDADKRQQERIAAMGNPGPSTATASAGGPPSGIPTPRGGRMIEVIANDRLGKKVRVKCLPTDTVGDLKKLIAVQTGTAYQKIQLKKWYTIYKDHISLRDYEINDGMSLEMY